MNKDVVIRKFFDIIRLIIRDEVAQALGKTLSPAQKAWVTRRRQVRTKKRTKL